MRQSKTVPIALVSRRKTSVGILDGWHDTAGRGTPSRAARWSAAAGDAHEDATSGGPGGGLLDALGKGTPRAGMVRAIPGVMTSQASTRLSSVSMADSSRTRCSFSSHLLRRSSSKALCSASEARSSTCLSTFACSWMIKASRSAMHATRFSCFACSFFQSSSITVAPSGRSSFQSISFGFGGRALMTLINAVVTVASSPVCERYAAV